jgi:N6-adenosine-specific RNA methylase IME4
MADPPWPYKSPRAVVGNGGRGGQNGRAAEIIQADVLAHYKVMTVDDIKRLPVEAMAAANSHLYLWTTNSFMVEAHEVARAWGFKPKTILTWAKVKIGKEQPEASMKTGHWYRSATEHIIFAVRGKQKLLGPAAPTLYFHRRLPHSVKPDMFYDLIEKQSPGPYLELFARRVRDGWDGWGDEIESAVSLG